MITNENPFCGTNEEDIYSRFWYDRLFDHVISMFHFTGAEFENGDLNERYLNTVLLLRGYAAFFRRNGVLRALDCTYQGIDIYNEPKKLMISNHTFQNPAYVVPDVNAVLIKNNKLGLPSFEVIKYYASLLGKLQTSLRVDLSNARMTKIFTARNDPQANQIRKMIDDIDKGVHGAIIKRSVFDDIMTTSANTPIMYSSPADYLVDKYLADTKTILNEFFSTFGINSSGANMQKGERNLSSEVHSNDQQIEVASAFYLEPRKEAIQKVNKLFGVNLAVEIRKGDNYVSAEGNGTGTDFFEPEV